ncbi:hypothetical protein MOX01_22700 [Microbacterium oxydans]|nr:hypothetical protein MOX01_22700 [Microbacterium oxydans]
MGKRDMTVYTCDGCGATATVRPDEKPPGFKTITINRRDRWLCTICFGAVEWVARFQRITHPPRVYCSEGKFSLRATS